MPERVCPQVGANRHKSPSSSSEEGDWKRGTNAQNPPRFSRGSLQQGLVTLSTGAVNRSSTAMRTQSEDTNPEVERVQVELLRKAGMARRLQLGLELSGEALEMAQRGIRRANPDASEL